MKIGSQTPIQICNILSRFPDVPAKNNFFFISQEGQQNVGKVANIANQWSKLAKLECTIVCQWPRKEVDPELFSIIAVSHTINSAMRSHFMERFQPSTEEIYLCRDAEMQPQGIMILKKGQKVAFPGSETFEEALELVYLATHPKHLKWPIGPHHKKSPGIGTALFKFAARRVLQLQLSGLYFESDIKANPFYDKMGADTGFIKFEGQNNSIPLHFLTAQKIDSLCYTKNLCHLIPDP